MKLGNVEVKPQARPSAGPPAESQVTGVIQEDDDCEKSKAEFFFFPPFFKETAGWWDQSEPSLIFNSTLLHLTSPPWRLRGKRPAVCCPSDQFIPLTGATSPQGPEPCLFPGT